MTNLIGQTLLKRYRVDDFIGRGAMADVYKVWDSQRATYLAMKLLREDLAMDTIFLRRFRREAHALAQLQHPHIVRFYSLEEDELLAFILLDYIDGTTLRQEIHVARRPLPIGRVLEVMRPVCSALHFAHQQGMIHCDMKPSNVMLHKNGTILITDFGLAHISGAAATSVLMLGGGTVGYMAPEQARGERPSAQTDIYALGIVLFEMLTGGERPFTGEASDRDGAVHESVLWEQLNLAPPSLRRWNPEIDAQFDLIVRKCLAVAPAERYGSALELLAALEGAAPADEVVAVAPVGGSAQMIRRSWRLPLALAVVALIAVLVGFAINDRLNRSSIREQPTVPGAGVVAEPPTATFTATATATPTATTEPTATATATATAADTPTLTATATATVTATPTRRRPTLVPRTPTPTVATVASPTIEATTAPEPTQREETRPPPQPATPAQP